MQDIGHVLDVIVKLNQNADSCRRAAEMYGTRAAEDFRRGFFGSSESSFLIAIRYARIAQANQDAAQWLLPLASTFDYALASDPQTGGPR